MYLELKNILLYLGDLRLIETWYVEKGAINRTRKIIQGVELKYCGQYILRYIIAS